MPKVGRRKRPLQPSQLQGKYWMLKGAFESFWPLLRAAQRRGPQTNPVITTLWSRSGPPSREDRHSTAAKQASPLLHRGCPLTFHSANTRSASSRRPPSVLPMMIQMGMWDSSTLEISKVICRRNGTQGSATPKALQLGCLLRSYPLSRSLGRQVRRWWGIPKAPGSVAAVWIRPAQKCGVCKTKRSRELLEAVSRGRCCSTPSGLAQLPEAKRPSVAELWAVRPLPLCVPLNSAFSAFRAASPGTPLWPRASFLKRGVLPNGCSCSFLGPLSSAVVMGIGNGAEYGSHCGSLQPAA